MIRSHNELFRNTAYGAFLLIPCLAFFLTACSQSEENEPPKPKAAAGFDPMSLALTDLDLIEGRKIWMANCTVCHLGGLTGAPKIGDKNAWQPRIEKGIEVLFDHAINGFIGPTYSEMPPKGGFKDLTNEQVKQAVLFMVEAGK